MKLWLRNSNRTKKKNENIVVQEKLEEEKKSSQLKQDKIMAKKLQNETSTSSVHSHVANSMHNNKTQTLFFKCIENIPSLLLPRK